MLSMRNIEGEKEIIHTCHGCIHEKDPIFVFGSAVRTLTVGSLIFIVALAFSDLFRGCFEKVHCSQLDCPIKNKERDEQFHKSLKYAITATVIALILSFLVMFYIPGTKW